MLDNFKPLIFLRSVSVPEYSLSYTRVCQVGRSTDITLILPMNCVGKVFSARAAFIWIDGIDVLNPQI